MAFRDVVGHRRLVGLLGRAAAVGSVPPSLIFSGPDGVGKRQVALAVAQALNCPDPVTVDGVRDGCGRCASCGKIARDKHPDVIAVAPDDKGTIRIDPIRDLIRKTAYRPFEGRVRVAVVDQADAMPDDSQNALLKTLEEPQPSSVFILVTSRPDMLLETVRSRCCHLRFAPLAAGDIASGLVSHHGYAERDARAVAALAGGSFSRALAAGTEEFGAARAVAAAVLQEIAGSRDARLRLAAGAALLKVPSRRGRKKEQEQGPEPEPDPEQGGGKSPSADRRALALRLRAMGSLLRDTTILITSGPDAAMVNLDLRAELEPLARAYDRDRIMRAFAAVGRALGALERHNASPKIVVDWLAFQL